MGRIGITYEQVAYAADKLIASDIQPTIEKIRRELGDTGSHSNIAKYFREWKEKKIYVSSANFPTSKDLPDPIQKTIGQIWEQLNLEASQQVATFKQEIEQALQKAREDNDQLSQTLHHLQEELQKKNLKLNHLETDLKLSQAELIQERKSKAVLEEKIQHVEQTLAQLKNISELRLKESSQLYENHLKEMKEQLQQSILDLNDYKDQLEKHRHGYIVQLDEYRTYKEKTESQIIKLQTELKQKQIEIKEKDEQNRALMIDLKVAIQRNEELQQLFRDKEKQYLVSSSEIRVKDSLISSRDEMIKELKEMNSGLQALLKKKEDEKEAVDD